MSADYDYIVVGLGVFGLSTCLELVRKDYTVLALDAYSVPSACSAANDLNKIVRTEYADMAYTRLAVEALQQWQLDPVFSGSYHQCGRLMLSPSSHENARRIEFENQGYQNLRALGALTSEIETLISSKEIASKFSHFSQNKLRGSVAARFNPDAGYAHTANSLKSAYEELKNSPNITFKFGSDAGFVKKILTHRHESPESLVTVTTRNGDCYIGQKVLVACGAATPYLIDCKDQLHALGLLVTHIKLTDEEYEKYKNMPIFFSAEKGYFFPPDRETKRLKIALTFADFTNRVQDPWTKSTSVENKISLPKYTHLSQLPLNGNKYARSLLTELVPELAHHELVDPKICWISDTCDSHFLIDEVPQFRRPYYEDSAVFVSSGDSGHGAKFFPNIGRYIVRRMEGTLEPELRNKWRWREFPSWPEGFATRAKRLHVDLKDVEKSVVKL